MILRLALILTTLVLSACPARNVAHDPEKMKPYTASHCFVLDEALTYSERRGIGVLWEQGLRAGTYRPALEDDKGYFFIGPDDAVCQGNPECGEFGAGFGGEGGVWVAKGVEGDVRLFVVFEVRESDEKTYRDAGVLINALIQRDHGKMFIFDRNEDFVAAIGGKRRECPAE